MICLSARLYVPMSLHVWYEVTHEGGGVGMHDIHCGPKSYKLILLGNLVV